MIEDLDDIVRAAQEGGLEAFTRLVREFQDVTLGCAVAYLGDYQLAEDVSQEAWVRAWFELPRLREPAAFAGWLRQVTLGCCSRSVRGRRLSVVPLDLAHEVAHGGLPPDEGLLAIERDQAVRRAVSALPEHQREIVVLYYLACCSQRTIAAILGVPETTVKKRLYDARQRLKEGMIGMVQEGLARRAPSSGDTYVRKVLEGVGAQQTNTTGWSSLICCMQPMLAAAGVAVSVPRLAGIFGHAFSFYVSSGPKRVWQDENIDWQYFWQSLDLVGCRFDEVQVIGTRATPSEIQAAKERAWEATRRSIDEGVPAMAWQPMTRAQLNRGLDAYEWGLLTGYDSEQGSYIVRHKARATAHEVPYDGFGDTDDVQWFAVMWPVGRRDVDDAVVARRALAQAVAYARGKRFAASEPCFRVDALGLAAYEAFRQRMGAMTVADVRTQIGLLRWARQTAAAFCREIATAVPWCEALHEAAAHYDCETSALTKLHELGGDMTLAETRHAEADELMMEATQAEVAAVAVIERVLAA